MNGLREQVGAAYVAVPILLALRRRHGGEALARLDRDGMAALREWLARFAPAAGEGASNSTWDMAALVDACFAKHAGLADLLSDLLEPYGVEPDRAAFLDVRFRACLNRLSRRLLLESPSGLPPELRLGEAVLVPFLAAAARSNAAWPRDAAAWRALADAFGADLRHLLDASGLLDGLEPDVLRAEIEGVVAFREPLLQATRYLSILSEQDAEAGAPGNDHHCALPGELVGDAVAECEAAVLARFAVAAALRPRYLALVGEVAWALAERLADAISRQDQRLGIAASEAPRIVCVPAAFGAACEAGVSAGERADAARAAWRAELGRLDIAAADAVDRIDALLPVCLLDGAADQAAIHQLGGLLALGARAALVLARHGAPCAVESLDGTPCTGLVPRMLRLLGLAAGGDAEAFLIEMAAHGLYARTPPLAYAHAACRRHATLGEFEARDYRIRAAVPEDLGALLALEAACWPAELRMPEATLAARLGRHAAGQFVLDLAQPSGGYLPVGVIYSQRIASVAALHEIDADRVDSLHVAGAPVVQLLAVNVDPACQARRLGDELLEFMLQRCAALPEVQSLVAVTLCRDFHKHPALSIEAYLALRNASGVLADPILRFHELHGARIERPMPGYRPRDARNAGFGVLVSYDLAHRERNELGLAAAASSIDEDGAAAGKQDRSSRAIDAGALHAFIEDSVRRIVGEGGELAYARDLPLMQLGLDSVGLLEFGEALARYCGTTLVPTFLFRHNTPAAIVAHFESAARDATVPLAAPRGRASQADKPASADVAAPRAIAPDAIAIVGMACRLPGGLDTPEAFWNALQAGTCVVGERPGERWRWPGEIDPRGRHRGIDRGGFLDDIACFDAGLFRLSPKEVATMDPQQRILLELAWQALESAGYSADAVAGSRTGVYVGASGSDYRLLLEAAGIGVEAHVATGASMAVIANRISYSFDLRGPSIQVDTACSSSLVALHQAAQALRAGECEQALVGGINVICHPGNTIAYYKAGMLSPDGLCKTLDDSADGYVRSEGAVMLMLRRLDQALRDGDPIHAVLRGSACNHGGLTGGLTVPHPDRQADLLRAAWAAAGVTADQIGYLEMHGTGTRLGDPIEVRGLIDAFGTRDAAGDSCGIGSVKSNLGHLEAAAGLAGVLKTVLGLAHREIPPSLHVSRLNTQITLSGTPFVVVDTPRPWPMRDGVPRLAGVSSFGSGGANAHVVLEAGVTRAEAATAGDVLVLLGARSREQLIEYAGCLLAYCERHAPAAADVAYTLQRRQPMPYRLAFVADSVETIARRLRAFVAGAAEPGLLVGAGSPDTALADFVNRNPDVQQVLAGWMRERRLEQLARCWVDGARITNWTALHDARPACLPLPGHPFARERHWFAAPSAPSVVPVPSAAGGYPGKLSLTPDAAFAASAGSSDVAFQVRLDAEASYLADHRLDERAILPGVVHFELAHAALAALPGAAPSVLELRDLAWLQPLEVSAASTLTVRLLADEPAGTRHYEACSGAPGTASIHARATIPETAGAIAEPLDLAALRARFDLAGQASHAEACHRCFERMGFRYGPAHRGLVELAWGEDPAQPSELLARIELPACVAGSREQFRLPPALLDAAVQAGMALAIGRRALADSPACVPFSLDRLIAAGPCPARAWAWVRRTAGTRASIASVDLDLCDEDGRVWASLRGLAFRPLRASATPAASRAVLAEPAVSTRLFRPRWRARPIETAQAPVRDDAAGFAPWLLLCGFEREAAARRDLAAWRDALPDTSIVAIDAEGATPAERFADLAGRVFEQVRELAREGKAGVALQLLLPADGPASVFAALAGLVRSARLEQPSWSAQVLSIDAAAGTAEALAWVRESRADAADRARYRREIGQAGPAVRESLVFEPLEPSPALANPLPDERWRPWKEGGVYLITGGAGELGLAFAREIAAQLRSATIVLAGRSAADAVLAAKLDAIGRRDGLVVRHRQLDVGDAAAVRALVESLRREHGHLSGVIHAAGLTRDTLLARQSREDFDAVLRPKVAGAEALYAATADIGLDFLVSFSSIVGVTGNLGQAGYGAGNAFLDACAESHADRREARHGRVLSIGWPLWRDGGMGRQPSVAAHFERAFGLVPMATEYGIAAFYQALASDAAHVVVGHGDAGWTPERAAASLLASRPRVARQADAGLGAARTEAGPGPVLDEAARRRAVLAYLVGRIAAVLGHAPERLDIHAPFASYGMDSILALDTTRAIEAELGSLSKTLFFEHENVQQLADHLVDEHAERLAAHGWFAAPAPSSAAGSTPAARPAATVDAGHPPGAILPDPRHSPPADDGARRYRRVDKARLSAEPRLAEAVARADGGPAVKGIALLEIWPELFVDTEAGAYCHLLVEGGIAFATRYTGEARHRQALFTALLEACRQRGDEFGYLDLSAGRKPDLEAGCGLLAAPVGVVQTIESIGAFSLAGGRMRRLRYMVDRFRKAGTCRVVEYREPDPAVAREIRHVICAWSDAKKVVNNVDVVLGEMAAGHLQERYRVFLTYLGEVLQNVIMITPDGDGYLMDQEYYLAEMPLGGTEYAVSEILATLAAEGRERFSLGLTWGLFDTGEGSSDPEGDAFLAGTRTQLRAILERGAANRQYKSKYGTKDHAVYLYRRPGKPETVIAGCLSQFYRKGLTHRAVREMAAAADAALPVSSPAPTAKPAQSTQVRDACDVFDATRVDPATLRLDLISDSWAHVDYPHMRERATRLDLAGGAAAADEAARSLAALFGFEHCLPTTSGRSAEQLLFRTLRGEPRRVPQNLLFESTLHNLVRQGFEAVELPDPRALDADSRELFRGGIDLAGLDRELQGAGATIAMVALELANNASGGYPVSLAQIRATAEACRRHAVPLVLDVTRILKNAELIRRHEPGQARRGLWEIVREIADHADAVVGSLCKDFGLAAGGLLAVRDARQFTRAAGIARLEGGLPGPAELRRIAAACADRADLAREIGRQIDGVAVLHRELERLAIPVLQPGAAHCVLLRADRFAATGSAASRDALLRQLAQDYGLRGGMHHVGNLRDSHLNHCVRFALPLGLDLSRVAQALPAVLAAAREAREYPLEDLLHAARDATEARPARARAASPADPADPAADAYADAIAIVGLAGRYPGAPTLDAFWQNLAAGRRSISEIPAERWDWRDHYEPDPDAAVAAGKSYGKWGGFLDGFDEFDPLFFQIAPREAEYIDPQERLFLEACWHALEDAGYPPGAFTRAERARIGVFGGITKQGFNLYGAGQAQPYQSTSLATLVNRVSHCLDFNGPAMAFDSHCASALVAIHEACHYLRREPLGIAIAGAVNLNLHPSSYQQLAKLQVLATGDASTAFASGGLGYVPGEGVGAVVLKSYRRALADGDPIHGLIRGSAVNQNGRMNRFGMPSQKQQEAVLRAALERSGVDPRSIAYIEASAQGSAVGDAIEMAALTRVFGARERAGGRYRIGSVKPNVGHGEAVSGMAQLSKVLLAFRHRRLPPTVVSGERNPDIDFAALPFELDAELADWEPLRIGAEAVPRRAGITSTGASGLNVHLVVEEYQFAVPAPRATAEAGPRVFVLSARDRARLDDYARAWLAFLDTAAGREAGEQPEALAWTLQAGREAMPCRLAVVARDGRELAARLARWLETGAADARELFHGELQAPARRRGRAVSGAGEAIELARAWVEGAEIDWAARHEGAAPRRLAGLPTYPFQRRRFWPGPAASSQRARAADERAAVSPSSRADAGEAVAIDADADADARLAAAFLPRFGKLVAEVFQVPADELELDRPLEDYGINSFLIKVLNVRFSEIFGRLSSTLLFEHRSAGQLGRHFLVAHRDACAAWAAVEVEHRAVPEQAAAAPSATAPAAAHGAAPAAASARARGPLAWDEPIAIIGVSGRYPQAPDLDQFWDNLRSGRDSITEIPADRWPLEDFYEADRERAIGTNRSYGKWGGFIDGFAEFDPLFFNLSPREASNMDPQERIFLQACWQALEDAAYTRARIAHQHHGRLGVFAGITRSEFSLYGAERVKHGKAPFTSFCSLVNRVSYFLDANGPSMPVDTMCSSSLVAVHEACEKLRHGECEVALAGGVNLALHPYMYVSLSAQRMLSSDGRCKTFGLGGNGYVPGEGVGVIVLKPLSRALADGDRIHAMIRASCVNHGGKTNGYTVPNPVAQRNVVRGALDRAGIDARSLSYIEAHGTGTELGDPIEITGLTGAFRHDTDERGFCAIGSVKTNIGHLEAASGIAGLTKVLLQMRYGQLVPSLHAEQLNPGIDFTASPFVVNRETRPWARPVVDGREYPRLAGVSSFGAGGSNAHVILEEAPRVMAAAAPAVATSGPASTPAGGPVLIVLSAKKPEQLRRYASELLTRLRDPEYRRRAEADGLRSLACTLQLGREAMEERLAVVADSVLALETRLSQFVDGKADIENLHVSRVGRSPHHVN
ncbi:SDR family NAD(P)-dependent oxidoreductase [Burkholderia gladioli]|uniref:SDR family NAD(P)-dependent oxidoreductase n=1 Tax=Burkholderia gladioli TaxID=28095 RepID=UPI0016405393|nr:SDR family NAD(P)-dependent oxidoreductase [Burkholderia gladioli]